MEIMEKAAIFHQMSQYDFSTPINTTIIFEEDSEEKYENSQESLKNDEELKEVSDLSASNLEVDSINNNVVIKEEKEDFIYIDLTEVNLSEIDLNEDHKMDCGDTVNNSKQNTHTSSTDSTKSDKQIEVNNQNVSSKVSSSQDISKEKSNSNSEMYNQINRNAELTAYVKDLLNTLSEHLILIMKMYYHVGEGKGPELTSRFNKHKKHFFDLSYSSVVSLILPHENNKAFIEQFLDKTVADARKVFDWNCSRQHVEPFYNEMIEWAKQKRNLIKNIGLFISNNNRNIENRVHGMAINENNVHNSIMINSNQSRSIINREINKETTNILLKKRLAEPPQHFNLPHPTGAAAIAQVNQNEKNINTETVCIFSNGTPGREISLNINTEIYKNHTKQLYSHITHAPSKKKPRWNKIRTSPPYPFQNLTQWAQNQRAHQVQNNIFSQNPPVPRPPPPEYGFQPQHTPTAIPGVYHYKVNQIHNNYPQSRLHYENNNHNSLGHISNFGFTQSPSPEAQFTPVITNVTSLNDNTSNVGSCCVCGKMCTTRCSKCQKLSYCSYLCQELNASIHQAICSKT